MIRNDEQLAIVKKQCALIEHALESLHADVFPKNPRNFAILSEGYVEQIDILKADIDAYLAAKKTHVPETSPTPTRPEDHGVKAP